MSSKRILVVVMAVLVALTASLALAQDTAAKTAAPKDADKAPRLTVIEPVKDYGVVPKGEKLTWAFTVKNSGTSDLQIIAARPACGCTVTDFDKVIKPGETGKVNAHVDTTSFNGPIAKSVTLETNDPVTPTAQLTIHATVKPYVEAYPAGFVRYSILQGDAEMQTLILYSEESEPFEIVKVEAPADYVKVNYAKITNEAERAPNVGTPGQNQYKVSIVVGGPDAKLGPLADKVKIITNSKHQPEYLISLSGVVRPPFRVEPTVMNFGEVAPNDVAASRAIVIKSNDLKTPERLLVTKAESSSPTITTSVKAGANKGEYEVTLQVAKDAKPGDVEGTVKIYTNDQVTPVVTVPVKATVKAAPKAAAAK
jgi:hypothetical protein